MRSLSNNLAPTNSTTAQLVMGDAIAIALWNARFKPEDFAVYHPGGALAEIIVACKDMLEHTLNLWYRLMHQ
jgi:arabinose-5-phosphate isomerase